MDFYRDKRGKILINVIPTDLLASIRGIGEITIEKIKLLKDIGCTLNLENTTRALPSQYFTKESINALFSFESNMTAAHIEQSQSDPCINSEKCAESVSGSKSCTVARPRSSHMVENVSTGLSKISIPTCTQTFTMARSSFATTLPSPSDASDHGPFEEFTPLNAKPEMSFVRSSDLDPQALPFVAARNEPKIKVKASSLPVFSGSRADWPEFKVLWPALTERLGLDELQLCMELKRACKGKAGERLRNITSGKGAYSKLWDRLLDEYDDPGLSCQEAIARLHSMRSVAESDYKGMIKLIDTVEGVYNQLAELGQVQAVHAIDIDRVASLLPPSTKMVWLRIYQNLSRDQKVAPLSHFWNFLCQERGAVARLSEMVSTSNRRNEREMLGSSNRRNERVESHFTDYKNSKGVVESKLNAKGNKSNRLLCAVCGEDSTHTTENCIQFRELNLFNKYQALKRHRLCFACMSSQHKREECSHKCEKCGKSHHTSLCKLVSAST